MKILMVVAVLVGSLLGGSSASAKPVQNFSISLASESPSLGDTVFFDTEYPKSMEKNIRISISCFQNGEIVWGDLNGPDSPYLLGGDWSPWKVNGGYADCEAGLYELIWRKNQPQQWTLLASTSFVVAG